MQTSPSPYLAMLNPQKAKPKRRWLEPLLAFARSQSAWLMSMLVHVLLLLFLALVVITSGSGIQGVLLTSDGNSNLEDDMQLLDLDLNAPEENLLVEDTVEPTQYEKFQQSIESSLSELIATNMMEKSISMESESSAPSARTSSQRIAESEEAAAGEKPGGLPMHAGMLSGRSDERRAMLLKKYGGSESTEAAVRLGIEWLMKQQTTDGSWSLVGPYSSGGRAENQVAATSMALLAILGAGNTHKTGIYKKQVHDALKWLVSKQLQSGEFSADMPMHHGLYTHAQATLVLTEAYAMTDDSWLRPYCERAVRYALYAQGPKGGWRYEPRGDSDTSVTGWFMIALVSARSAGFEVPEANLRRINVWLSKVDHDEGSTYSYVEGMPSTPAMTAEGLLCRMYLGWDRSRPALEKGGSMLLKVAPFQTANGNYYYWYYATQVMHHLGGKSWDKWNNVMREQLPALQVKQEPDAGSWSPGSSRHDGVAGRLYTTCMALYCLEVYYRHLPIYGSPWDADK